MTTRIAINGFGRIGRMVFRALCERKDNDLEVVAINDLTPADTNVHLLKYDSVHGAFGHSVTLEGDILVVDAKRVRMLSEKNPANLPWKDMGVDLVMECSGVFTSKDSASAHLDAGAKRVLISAPATGVDATIVYGVNHNVITKDTVVVSNASCTTNCLAPLAKVLHDTFGIEHGFMTTIHAFTGDQRLVDTGHKDLRRARAATLSMIPTSTGAARSVGLVMPELAGKIDGSSVRVPTANVSFVDFTFVSKTATSVSAVNNALETASQGFLAGILRYEDAPLVSSDFNHDSHSSIVDALETQVVDATFVRVAAWYDNEWGFSQRMLDTALVMARTL
ncbi:MAG: type I glyceraldehyde-3-phosphate dehydrogenase [Candidatus Puniceispirillum sp.]|nr:type I glyceraldehyde-3-phosphate dehydrogenase [Candidatus Puniceispirillum sp.]